MVKLPSHECNHLWFIAIILDYTWMQLKRPADGWREFILICDSEWKMTHGSWLYGKTMIWFVHHWHHLTKSIHHAYNPLGSERQTASDCDFYTWAYMEKQWRTNEFGFVRMLANGLVIFARKSEEIQFDLRKTELNFNEKLNGSRELLEVYRKAIHTLDIKWKNFLHVNFISSFRNGWFIKTWDANWIALHRMLKWKIKLFVAIVLSTRSKCKVT